MAPLLKLCCLLAALFAMAPAYASPAMAAMPPAAHADCHEQERPASHHEQARHCCIIGCATAIADAPVPFAASDIPARLAPVARSPRLPAGRAFGLDPPPPRQAG
jgi:hypothetical protein